MAIAYHETDRTAGDIYLGILELSCRRACTNHVSIYIGTRNSGNNNDNITCLIPVRFLLSR